MKPFDSVLVANRGEIAVRIIQSARQQGYRTIAVYSDADADALHVSLADEAVRLGPAPVSESYLDPERILQAARTSGAEAIHPGYGFLSENAAFARACEAADMVFIGPSVEAIDIMGNKAAAKRRMLAAGVPCIPGYQDADQSDANLLEAATAMGLPVMVKAAAGGGGRGMRLVNQLAELPGAIVAARSEAENAFGSGELILEKAVLRPRHVEIQVFGDQQGTILHLGERDCSVQRRHQKVIEEAPCPVMTEALREAMGRAAISAARSVNYVGAGTVEFLLDEENNFYFLEMNTRLQVEHPVTELVTGLDLVALQFGVAQGHSLPLDQDAIRLQGHAIEARLYAEDSNNDFLPATGRAALWVAPQGEGIRVDHGLQNGQEIPPFYDPMIAKIIAWGADRDSARRRLLRALENTVLLGVPNNRRFLIDVLRSEGFSRGAATTALVEDNFSAQIRTATGATAQDAAIAAVIQTTTYNCRSHPGEHWAWRTGQPVASQHILSCNNENHCIMLDEQEPHSFVASVDSQQFFIRDLEQTAEGCSTLIVNNLRFPVWHSQPAPGSIAIQYRGQDLLFTDQLTMASNATQAGNSGDIVAPMHGNLMSINVTVGEHVTRGTLLAVMEAMKMEHRLTAESDGSIKAIYVSAGEQIAAGTLIMELEAD